MCSAVIRGVQGRAYLKSHVHRIGVHEIEDGVFDGLGRSDWSRISSGVGDRSKHLLSLSRLLSLLQTSLLKSLSLDVKLALINPKERLKTDVTLVGPCQKVFLRPNHVGVAVGDTPLVKLILNPTDEHLSLELLNLLLTNLHAGLIKIFRSPSLGLIVVAHLIRVVTIRCVISCRRAVGVRHSLCGVVTDRFRWDLGPFNRGKAALSISLLAGLLWSRLLNRLLNRLLRWRHLLGHGYRLLSRCHLLRVLLPDYRLWILGLLRILRILLWLPSPWLLPKLGIHRLLCRNLLRCNRNTELPAEVVRSLLLRGYRIVYRLLSIRHLSIGRILWSNLLLRLLKLLLRWLLKLLLLIRAGLILLRILLLLVRPDLGLLNTLIDSRLESSRLLQDPLLRQSRFDDLLLRQVCAVSGHRKKVVHRCYLCCCRADDWRACMAARSRCICS